jgi:hypothetical protein
VISSERAAQIDCGVEAAARAAVSIVESDSESGSWEEAQRNLELQLVRAAEHVAQAGNARRTRIELAAESTCEAFTQVLETIASPSSWQRFDRDLLTLRDCLEVLQAAVKS